MPVQSNKYIATFPAGCYEIVARQLKQFSVDELKIINHDTSSLTFASTFRAERLIEFRFFTNVYLVLDQARLSSYKPFIYLSGYRLLSSVNGEPQTLDNNKKDALTLLIESQLHLERNAKRSVDIVLIKRTGQDEMLTLRLARAKHKREELPKGALRPELAHILLLVARIKSKETLLDPFAGFGSIPLEALRGFGVKNVIAVEKDADLAKQLIGKGFQAIQGDATALDMIPDASIDRVVTDPPWGLFDATDDLGNTYMQSLVSIKRVLKPKGVAVILSGSELLDEVIRSDRDFSRLNVTNILVSGKKASIVKLQKTSLR